MSNVYGELVASLLKIVSFNCSLGSLLVSRSDDSFLVCGVGRGVNPKLIVGPIVGVGTQMFQFKLEV